MLEIFKRHAYIFENYVKSSKNQKKLLPPIHITCRYYSKVVLKQRQVIWIGESITPMFFS